MSDSIQKFYDDFEKAGGNRLPLRRINNTITNNIITSENAILTLKLLIPFCTNEHIVKEAEKLIKAFENGTFTKSR